MLWARGLLAPGAVALSMIAAAHAQNLDQGKSGAKLFADSCATCHRSARGLSKGRFSLSLYLFLQQHYVSNSGSAWALASYLETLDETPRGRSHPASGKRAPAHASQPSAPPRPPASIPLR